VRAILLLLAALGTYALVVTALHSPADPYRPVVIVPHATIVTTNVPDGRCHEDDPCFIPTITLEGGAR
jgi:hypothetical protein